jgi:hypothetical protein
MGDQEFIDQMTAAVRVFNPDKHDKGTTGAYEWTEGSKPDHYHLAMTYMFLARWIMLLTKR